MHRTQNSSSSSLRESNESRSVRKAFVFCVVLISLLAVVLVFHQNKPSKPAAPAPKRSATKAKVAITHKPMPALKPSATPAPTKLASAVAARPVPISPEFLSANQLVDELTKIGNGPITPEQAARFKADLKELIRRGAVSVPAIQKFFDQNMDIAYADVKGGDLLGYSSLRASLIDALNQIGGSAAQAAMLKVMNTTAVPSELLTLADDLNKQAPGKNSDQIVNGAEQILKMAANGELPTNTEVGPAFRALQNYGSANTTADLANDRPLVFYAAVELANMPDGQGLSSLIQMEKNSSGDSHVIATEMIAQLANQNADALDTLAQLAQSGQIQQSEWVKLAPILGGNQYQIDSMGANYTIVQGATTPDQINQRIEVIDALLNFVPDGSAAAFALGREEATLLKGELGGN